MEIGWADLRSRFVYQEKKLGATGAREGQIPFRRAVAFVLFVVATSGFTRAG